MSKYCTLRDIQFKEILLCDDNLFAGKPYLNYKGNKLFHQKRKNGYAYAKALLNRCL